MNAVSVTVCVNEHGLSFSFSNFRSARLHTNDINNRPLALLVSVFVSI